MSGAVPLQKKTSQTYNRKVASGLYRVSCSHCHGVTGKGDGPAAAYMKPRPRDFTSGSYKIRTTDTGEVPTDSDLFKTIKFGIPNSEMPGWSLLGDRKIRLLVAYIKSFSPDFLEEKPPRIIFGKPGDLTDQSIRLGRRAYHKARCAKCHGDSGRGDGPSAAELKDDLGNSIRPTNLNEHWQYKGGATPQDIFRTITTGLNGTPMPSYKDALSYEERRNLSNFVHSLGKIKRN